MGGLSQTPQVWLDCQALEWNGSLVVNWDERVGVFPNGLISDAFSTFEQTLKSLSSSKLIWDEVQVAHLPQRQKLIGSSVVSVGEIPA